MRALGEDTQKVHAYLQEHPDGRVTIRQIASATGLRNDTVSNSCGVLLKRDRKLRRIANGVYEYRRSGAVPVHAAAAVLPPGTLIEVLGHDAEGRCVSRDERGALYRLAPL